MTSNVTSNLTSNLTSGDKPLNWTREKLNISDINETFLELYIIPKKDRHLEEGYNISKLNFTWEVVHYQYDEMKVQLLFNDFPYVSSE